MPLSSLLFRLPLSIVIECVTLLKLTDWLTFAVCRHSRSSSRSLFSGLNLQVLTGRHLSCSSFRNAAVLWLALVRDKLKFRTAVDEGGLHCKTELAYFLENFNFRCLPRWILCRLICLLLPTFTAVCSFQFHFRLLILLLWSSLLFVRLLAVVLYSASSRRIALPSPSVRCSTLRLSSSYAFCSFFIDFPCRTWST